MRAGLPMVAASVAVVTCALAVAALLVLDAPSRSSTSAALDTSKVFFAAALDPSDEGGQAQDQPPYIAVKNGAIVLESESDIRLKVGDQEISFAQLAKLVNLFFPQQQDQQQEQMPPQEQEGDDGSPMDAGNSTAGPAPGQQPIISCTGPNAFVKGFDPVNGGVICEQIPIDAVMEDLAVAVDILDASLDCQDHGQLLLRRSNDIVCHWPVIGPSCPDAIVDIPHSTGNCADGTAYLDTCNVTCNEGYGVPGHDVIPFTCSFGEWIPTPGLEIDAASFDEVCSPKPCNVVPALLTANVDSAYEIGTCTPPILHGEACELDCAVGFEPDPAVAQAVSASCALGVLTETGRCRRKLCPQLTDPEGLLIANVSGIFEMGTFAVYGDVVALTCPSGYNLEGAAVTDCQADGTWSNALPVCEDIDECGENNGGCGQVCTNHDGHHECSCLDGYELEADQRTCVDIDECSASSPCDQSCTNTDGSFTCSCSSQYELDDDGVTCNARACPTLEPPSNTVQVDNPNGNHGDTRTFSCISGYRLSGSTTTTCNAPSWSHGFPTCALIGSSSAPAHSCKEILDSGASQGDGSYALTVGSVHCLMSVEGGGWTRVISSVADNLPSGNKQYLYIHGSNYYISPTTSLNWRWSSGQQQTGSYIYRRGSTRSSIHCGGSGERPQFGVGCSDGGGGTEKVLPIYSKNPGGGTCTICQDRPDAFFVGACRSNVAIYYRRV